MQHDSKTTSASSIRKQTVGVSSQHLNPILSTAKPLHMPTPITMGAAVLPAQTD